MFLVSLVIISQGMVNVVRERKSIYNNDFSLSHFMETPKSLSNVKSNDHLVV